MGTSNAADSGRHALGPVGVCLPVSFTSTPSAELQRDAVGRLERAGYRAVWTNEVLGKDAMVQLAVLLAATERMTFGTFIANIWAREPQTVHGAAALLAQAYPGRFALGLGVGYPEQAASTGREFGKPLARMRDYIGRMNDPTAQPAPDVAYPRLVAANGPKMLALAGEIADGALPAGMPPELTAEARRVLGPDKLLAVGVPMVLATDRGEAKTGAREIASGLLALPSYGAGMNRLGYSAQEVAEVSDRLVDAIVAHGDPTDIAAKVREHLTAGADHVALFQPNGGDFTDNVEQLEQLAPALAAPELGRDSE